MLTIEKLKKYGANVEEGVLRCAKNEALYIRLVGMIPNNPGFNKLYEAIKLKDYENAFSASHGLKGILANLSLDPILKPIVDITEHLRNKEDIDYTKYVSLIEEKRKELEDLMR